MNLKHNVFLLHPRHKYYEIIFVIILCIFLVVAILSLVFVFREIFVIRLTLVSEGVPTIGTYIDRDIESTGDGTFYSLIYNYTVDDHVYRRSYSTNKQFYDSTEIGDTIQIRYLPNNPNISRTVVELEQPPHSGMIFGTVWSLIVLVFIYLGLQKKIPVYLHGQLINGQLIDGEITDIWSDTQTAHNSYVIIVRYKFVEPQTGQLINDEAQTDRKDLSQKALPQVGTQLAIRYLNKNNYRAL
jgi:hypothetical protein